MPRLNFLLDTNVFITADPLSTRTGQAQAEVSRMLGMISAGGHRVFVHPRARVDLGRDRNEDRRATRRRLLPRYELLPDPPAVSAEMLSRIGSTLPKPGGNNDVDNHHLAALYAGAVSWLVTEDGGLRRKATAVGLGDKVGTIAETLDFLQGLSPSVAPAPLKVDTRKAHWFVPHLGDPIFDGLRSDYPEFERWLRETCVPEHRDALVIDSGAGIAALTILKEERTGTDEVLKICTLKVADSHNGFRYGELLIRGVVERCRKAGLQETYVTVLPKHERLLELLGDFGFIEQPARTERGEVVMRKLLCPPAVVTVEPLRHHVLFGPGALRLRAGQVFVVPVRPEWFEPLFPDVGRYQGTLFDRPLSNAIRKAYLSNASTRMITPGATLLFYRSQEGQAVGSAGVVEDVLISEDPERVATHVGKRTVYDLGSIAKMCRQGEVVAIRFRQDRVLDTPIPYRELLERGVLRGPPQSVTAVSNEEAVKWLKTRLDA